MLGKISHSELSETLTQNLGEYYLGQARTEKDKGHFDLALRLYDQAKETLISLGSVKEALRKAQGARTLAYEKLGVMMADAYFERGEVLDRLNSPDKARASYLKAEKWGRDEAKYRVRALQSPSSEHSAHSSRPALVQTAKPASMSFQRLLVTSSVQGRSKQVDYLFEKAFSTLGSLELPNKPSLFLVYAHDNPIHGKAEASTSKYLIEKLSQIQVTLYSDQTPIGQPYSSAAGDLKKDGKVEDILTNQLCLLPERLRSDVEPVDKVVVCCSEVLGSYLKWPDYDNFYQQLREAYHEDRKVYLKDGEQGNAWAIREVVRQFSQEEKYKAGFHHILTEMAFLQIRAERLKDGHGIIPVPLTRNSYDDCLSRFISATTVRMEDIPRFEAQAQAGREMYPNQSRHWVLFKLIERLLVDSDEVKTFLNKFWQGYSGCITCLKSEPSELGWFEFVKLVDDIFDDIRTALHRQLASLVNASLVKKLLGNLQENIQKLRAAYLDDLQQDREIKDALANYVSLEGMLVNDEKRFDLKSRVQDFLDSDKKVLLLLGEAGSGKSTFNRHLAVSLWEVYSQADIAENMRIPVFIGLSSLSDSNQNLVSAFFEKQGFSKEQIKELQKKRRFVLILDGFDEIEHRQQAFYRDNGLSDWKYAKVVISSRPEYLGPNYQYKFHPSGESSALQEYRLAPFSKETIERYIDRYSDTHPDALWSAERYKEALKESSLKELVSNPFLLKITLSVLPELSESLQAKKQRFTRIRIYEQFVKSWFERSQQRLAQIRLNAEEAKEFRRLENKGFAERGLGFSKKLAIEMYQAEEVVVTYLVASDDPWEEAVTESTHNWRRYLLGDENAMTVLMRLNAPLICEDKESGLSKEYRFIHKSLRDYFVSRALWEELDVHDEMKGSAWFNKLNVVNDPAVLSFLAERVRQGKKLKEQLLRVVEQSKGEKGAEFEKGAANAMTVLVRAGAQFNGVNLKGVRIAGADLSHSMFDSAQLENADLSGVNLRNSWLREANLSGVQMAGVQFGEWPYLKEESQVNSCIYSPDGKTCAMGLLNGEVSVYDTSSWTKIHTLSGHADSVWAVAYSPSGDQMVSGGSDRTVRVWETRIGELRHTLIGHGGSVSDAAYSPSGDQIASGGEDKTVRLWDAQSGELRRTLIGHTDWVYSVAYSPNGNQIASGSGDKTVRLWDAQSGELRCTLIGHEGSVYGVAYSPSGAQIASGGEDGTVRLWQSQSGTLCRTLYGHEDSVGSVVYSPSGAQIASGSDDKTVRLWDAQSGELRRTSIGHTNWVYSVAYSPNGNQIASGSHDETVRLWDVHSGALSHTLERHTKAVNSVVYSPNGEQIVSGSEDKTVQLWDAQSGELRNTLIGHTDWVNSVVYSPNGEQIVSGSEDKTVRLWDVQNGELRYTLGGHKAGVESVAYSPNGEQIASASRDRTIRLWDARSGELHDTLIGHRGSVYSLVYSPNGEQIASGSHDTTVRVWDTQSGELSRTLIGHASTVGTVAYSPSGDQIVSGSGDRTVRVWESQSGELRHTLIGHTWIVNSVAYSLNGDQIASGGGDRTVRLWEVASAQCLRVIQDFSEPVDSLAWKMSRGKEHLLASSGKSVSQWEVKKEGSGYKVVLYRISRQDVLTVTNTLIEGVQGLNAVNKRLLRQRGAVGEPFSRSRNAIQNLITALRNQDQNVRDTAARELCAQKTLSASAISALIPALKDDNWFVRYAAISALCSQKTTPDLVISALIQALKEDDRNARDEEARTAVARALEPAFSGR